MVILTISKGGLKGNAGHIWCLAKMCLCVPTGVCAVTAEAKRMIKELPCSED